MKITFKRPKFLLPLDTKETKQSKDKSGIFLASLLFGIVSFIPLCGVILGIIAITLSLIGYSSTRQRKYFIGLALGILGIIFTAILYGSLFYFGFVQRGGVYDNLRISMVKETQLPNTLNALEAYKVRYGKYPEKIEDLTKVSEDPFIYVDQLQMAQILNNFGKDFDRNFYYEKIDEDKYYLFSRGVDGVSFTEDDIYPEIKGEMGKIGYTKPDEKQI